METGAITAPPPRDEVNRAKAASWWPFDGAEQKTVTNVRADARDALQMEHCSRFGGLRGERHGAVLAADHSDRGKARSTTSTIMLAQNR